MKHHTNWVRRVEHTVLRIASLVFSVVSAHAILWFFSALNQVDHLQPFVTWGIAVGFGVLGYFVSRGLAHRLLNKEPVRAYVFICGVFELVEIVCNYAMAAVAVQWITWLGLVPSVQRSILTFLTYVVLSIIPVVTVMLAWVDMDLERAKQGYEVRGFGMNPPGGSPVRTPMPVGPLPGFGGARAAGPQAPMNGMRSPVQPKMAAAPITSLQGAAAAPVPSYPTGYTGLAAPASASMSDIAVMPDRAAIAAAHDEQAARGWWDKATGLLPFASRGAAHTTNQQ